MATTDHAINLVTNDFLLDDIDDLPAFVTLPTGAYAVHFVDGIEEKTVKMNDVDTSCFEIKMTVTEVAEITEELKEGEVAPKVGDVASMLWNRTHGLSMGNFKDFAKPIAKQFGCSTVGEVITASKGINAVISVKRTYNKDKDRHNMNIKTMVLI
jgi:hypothetical protein